MNSATRETRRLPVIGAVMLSMFMVAIEATIISTAMPQIAGQLGGLHLYSWVFAAFLLTQTAATVVFGKLSDVFGRRPTLLAGMALFMATSLACGFAWSMISLIVFRLLQGIGAGAIQPVAQTIVGDLYPAAERGKVQGALASVWAISAVLGPLIGALIVKNMSWAWVFWLNIPFGILASIGFLLFLHEGLTPKTRKVDIAGAVLFTLCIGALMVALTGGGETGESLRWPAAFVFVLTIVAFGLQERRAREPIIAFELWAHRPIAAANGAALLAGMALVGLTTFLPMYVQGVLQRSPVVAGLALTAVMFGWPCGATLATRLFRIHGLRRVMIGGSLLLPVGATAFLFLGAGASPVVAGAGSFVMGLGMGLLSSSAIVMIQEITSWAQRGSATASNVFARNLGSTLGAAIFGAVLNHGLSRSAALGPITSEKLQGVLANADATGSADAVRALLQGALHQTFVAVFIASMAAVVCAVLVPHVPMGRKEG